MWQATVTLTVSAHNQPSVFPMTFTVVDETMGAVCFQAQQKVDEVKRSGYSIIKREDAIEEI